MLTRLPQSLQSKLFYHGFRVTGIWGLDARSPTLQVHALTPRLQSHSHTLSLAVIIYSQNNSFQQVRWREPHIRISPYPKVRAHTGEAADPYSKPISAEGGLELGISQVRNLTTGLKAMREVLPSAQTSFLLKQYRHLMSREGLQLSIPSKGRHLLAAQTSVPISKRGAGRTPLAWHLPLASLGKKLPTVIAFVNLILRHLSPPIYCRA